MNKDIVSGAVMLAVSAAYYIGGARLPTSILDTAVSSATFPKIIGAAGMVLSLVLIAQGVVRRRAIASAAAEAPQDWGKHRKALGLFLVACGYILVLEFFGYIAAVITLIPAVAMYHGIRPGPQLAAVSVGGAVLFWLFFVKLLGIHMPPGIVWRALGLA